MAIFSTVPRFYGWDITGLEGLNCPIGLLGALLSRKLEAIRVEEAPIPLRLTYVAQRSDRVPRLQCHEHSLL
jgi:hypothetical protein